MKNKDRKSLQLEYAKKNIEFFIHLLKTRSNPQFDKTYVKEIKDLSTSFNIRLTREQKLLFCKKCNCYWDTKTRQIRLNSREKTKEYICLECNHIKRFKY